MEQYARNKWRIVQRIAQTDVNLEALYDIQTEKDLSETNKNEEELSYVDSLLTTGNNDY